MNERDMTHAYGASGYVPPEAEPQRETLESLRAQLAEARARECRLRLLLERSREEFRLIRAKDSITVYDVALKAETEIALSAAQPCEHKAELTALRQAIAPFAAYLTAAIGETSTRAGDDRPWVSIGDAMVTRGDVKRLLKAEEGRKG